MTSTKQRIIAREEATPVVDKVRSLLLRSGARGMVEYQDALSTAYDAAQAANTATATRAQVEPPLSSTQRQATAIKVRRLNPEDLKTVTRDAGVLLSPAEYKTLLMAFTDSVGFVLIDAYLSALSGPSNAADQANEAAILSVFPGSPSCDEVTADAEGASFVSLPPVTLSSVLELLVTLFSPLAPAQPDGELSVEDNNANAMLQRAYVDAADVFTRERYPSDCVPGQRVLSFLSAVLTLNAGQHRVVNLVRQRLADAHGALTTAPSDALNGPTPGKATNGAPTSKAFSMVHTGVRTERKFERYHDDDRRDEWLRGREERDAQLGYQRHVVGYGGHLPEYQYHFGRTFHVIEEDLPLLSKPKPPLEPAPTDAYGPARELKESRMNAHHYRLA